MGGNELPGMDGVGAMYSARTMMAPPCSWDSPQPIAYGENLAASNIMHHVAYIVHHALSIVNCELCIVHRAS